MPTKLTQAQRAALPDTLPQWTPLADRDALRRIFKFADFSAAWGFMSRIALIAERMDHHPEWSNTYNRVRIVLTSHDVNGLSSRDVEMARAIDAVVTS
jgi:4a-hydroxytetrahydrobiopterin dehydratase